ncbi:MAG: GIY-YIG nuclease family protein [Dehalococcoidales bacterium]|nr:GIY-YIG nuclease family protein [Dehalococcoidales bacterium]
MKENSRAKGKGSYVLLIELSREQTTVIGSLKVSRFPRGYYAYVGSALGGISARVNRHLQRNKKLRWHIDYLLEKASLRDIIVCETEDRVECTIARGLNRRFEAIPGFGSSDCKCPSHLYYDPDEMGQKIMAVLGSLGMKPEYFTKQSHGGWLDRYRAIG